MAKDYDTIDYVLWAQRSLNRIMSLQLTCDGKEIGPWRGALGTFKTAQGLMDPGLDQFQIGPVTQDLMIRLNDSNLDYLGWLHRHLPAAGQPNTADAMPKLRSAVRDFQKKHALKQDGWTGPRTESAMVRAWGEPPPGEYGTNRSPKPVPPRPPVPEWLREWQKLRPSVRYVRWMQDVASKVGATPSFDPAYQELCGVLARGAEENPLRYYQYFSQMSVQKVVNSDDWHLRHPGIEKLGDSRFRVPNATLEVYRLMMADTRGLNMICFNAVHTPDDYVNLRARFENETLNIFKSMHAGVTSWNWYWGKEGQALHDRLYVVRGIIEALMHERSHPYYAYAQMKSVKLDDMPGSMKIMLPWRWFDDVRL